MTGLLESAVRKLSFVWPTTEVSPHSAGYEGVPRVWPFNATEKLDPDVRELLSMHCSWCVLDCGGGRRPCAVVVPRVQLLFQSTPARGARQCPCRATASVPAFQSTPAR